jgi:hypothetical protein
MFELAEYNDMDALELESLLEESVKDTVQRENADELNALADSLESAFGESEEELIDALRATALTNPISETAEDLKIEAMEVL